MENVNEAESSANASAQAQTPSKSYDKSKELQLLKYSLNRIKDTVSWMEFEQRKILTLNWFP